MEPESDWLEIYHNGWSTHEEYDWTTIWETVDNQFWVHKTSYNVYTGSHESWVKVSEMAAIHEMIDAEEDYSEG